MNTNLCKRSKGDYVNKSLVSNAARFLQMQVCLVHIIYLSVRDYYQSCLTSLKCRVIVCMSGDRQEAEYKKGEKE